MAVAGKLSGIERPLIKAQNPVHSLETVRDYIHHRLSELRGEKIPKVQPVFCTKLGWKGTDVP